MNNSKSLQIVVLLISALSMRQSIAAPKESPELIAKGKKTYEQTCLMCHGPIGDGKGPAGAAFKNTIRNFKKDKFKGADGKGTIADPTATQVFEVVSKGVKGTAMAGYGHLKEDERWGVAYYVLQLRKQK